MGSGISKELHSLYHREMVHNNYGTVALVLIEAYVLNIYLIIRVARARKQYNVEVPTMYSLDSQEFNCIQRAHQNYLENVVFFVPFLFISGLHFPIFTFATGNIFLLGRYLYARGYQAEDPKKRATGLRISFFGGLLPLGASTTLLAINAMRHGCKGMGK